MTNDATDAALAAVLDALTLVQEQLGGVARGNARIEATQADILARLDTIDAAQAAVTDLVPVLEIILARSIEDRELTRTQLSVVAAVAGFAHAAASGSAAPLPVDVADNPLLERFALVQPANLISEERALADWRKAAAEADAEELVALLASQYHGSVSDTPKTRVLRYRVAAITRTEIEGRGLTPQSPPLSTGERESSPEARHLKSQALATLWRAGESTALFSEPELAGALDIFAAAERENVWINDERVSAELATLHRDLGERLEVGERPCIEEPRLPSIEQRVDRRLPDAHR